MNDSTQPGPLQRLPIWRLPRTKSLLYASIIFCCVSSAYAGDREDVLARIDQYMEYEKSGNLIAQGELMLDERTIVYPGGRVRGDNRQGMKKQQAEQDEFTAKFPGVSYEYELRDVQVQTWNADSAMVTFESVPTRIVPPSMPPEKNVAMGSPKVPLIVAVMLVKQQGEWKIAHTTFVPRDKD